MRTRATRSPKSPSPAPGLAAAIMLARTGRRMVVHEAQRKVGYRFQGDLHGIENRTTERDVLREMELTTAFAHLACHEGTAFDAWGRPIRSAATRRSLYMVERRSWARQPRRCPVQKDE